MTNPENERPMSPFEAAQLFAAYVGERLMNGDHHAEENAAEAIAAPLIAAMDAQAAISDEPPSRRVDGPRTREFFDSIKSEPQSIVRFVQSHQDMDDGVRYDIPGVTRAVLQNEEFRLGRS